MERILSAFKNQFLIAIVAGASLTLAFAPFHLWPISILALSSLIWLFSKEHLTKNCFYLGFCFGLGFFATSVSWVFVSIYKYGNTSIYLALLITSLFIMFLALFPAINLYLLKKFNLSNNVIAFPASWTLLEIFRGWVLTGFPWGLLGYTQLNSSLKYYASLFGVYGVSFVVALVASLLSFIILNKSYKNNKKIFFSSLILVLLIFIGPMLLHQQQLQKQYRKYHKQNINTVAILQSNIKPNDKFLLQDDPTLLIDNISEIYLRPTENLVTTNSTDLKIDLVIWPENSLPLPLQHYAANDFAYKLDQFAKQKNFGLLLGIPIYREGTNNYFYNSVLGLGVAEGVYHKINLVPFGDYIPLENLLRGIINFLDLPLSRFVSGAINQAPIKFNGHNLLATVCYDIAYAENLRVRVLAQNPSVIVAVSEDGWFGDSLGPWQHLDIARMRAIETGRYILRATTTGVSVVIDNYGNIVKKAPQFKESILVSQYQDCFQQTLWNKLGNKPIIYFLLICLVVAVWSKR